MAVENINDVYSKLEEVSGLEKGKLQEMISSEENHKFDIDSIVLRTSEDDDRMKSNLRNSTQEQFVKDLRNNESLGISGFQGKNSEALIEAITNRYTSIKTDAIKDIELPEDKQKILDEFVGKETQYKESINEWKTKYDTLQSDVLTKNKANSINSEFSKALTDEYLIDKKVIKLALEQKGFKFDNIDDEFVVLNKNGEVLKNNTMDNVTYSDFVKDHVQEYIKKTTGGSGKKDEIVVPKDGSFESFVKEMQAQGVEEGTGKFQMELNTRIKNGSLKM